MVAFLVSLSHMGTRTRKGANPPNLNAHQFDVILVPSCKSPIKLNHSVTLRQLSSIPINPVLPSTLVKQRDSPIGHRGGRS